LPGAAQSVPCALCGGESAPLHQVSGYWIRRCAVCAHQFAELDATDGHVQRIYGHDYFFGGGAGYVNYLCEERLLVNRGRFYGRVMSGFCSPGTVLDIGAASGFTLQGLQEFGWQCAGIEPNAEQAQYARDRFGFDVEATTLENWDAERRFDLITMLQVLPHFLDPAQALAKCAERLHARGYLLIETWNRESWTARLLGRNWHEYSPPSVLHWFSKDSIVGLADKLGLDYAACGRPSKWINAGHAKGLLRSKANESLFNRLLAGLAHIVPDRLAIPYPAEDLFWLLLRRR
jgi:2-polyprenyl-3-methyl-5-hydroxy-6-metoxy-1,4-benzoquinol methylase